MQEQATAGFWLSPQQKFAWKIEQEALQSSSRPGCLISLEGQLDEIRLRDALREIVSRHEILRTVFQRQTGMKVPFQVVRETPEFVWEQVDLSSIALPERESRIQELFATERTHECNLENGPPIR